MRNSSNTQIMTTKFLFIFSVLVVAAQAVELRFGYDVPYVGLDFGRIVGGDDAIKGEFPHQVSLQWGLPPISSFQHLCGGSIINSQWILTAGHCVHAIPSYGRFVVKAGKLNIKVTESDEQMSEVVMKIVHEKYQGGVAPYDIALLKLKTPLSVNKMVSAISLPIKGVKPSGNVILSGWGSVSPNGNNAPAKLQKVVLPIINLDSCKSILESLVGPSPLDSTNVCTGYMKLGQSACSGDSGGPLIMKDASGAAAIVGVVSWGVLPCGASGAPTVYVDVTQFVDWIQATIQKN